MSIAGYKNGKPDIAWWQEQVLAGLKDRKEQAFEDRWDRWRNYYRGKQTSELRSVNLFYMMLRSLIPRVYFRTPSVSIISKRPGPEGLAFAQVLQRVDNKLHAEMNTKKYIKRAVHNAFLYGTDAIKLGFGSEYLVAPTDGEAAAAVVDASSKSMQIRNEYRSGIKANMPWITSTHPSKFVFDPNVEDYASTRWVAHIIPRPVEDVQNDTRLKNNKGVKGSRNVQSTALPHTLVEQYSVDMVELVELRDKQTGKVIVFSLDEGNKDYYLFEDDTLLVDSTPSLYRVVFNDDDRTPWGLADSLILEPRQLEMTEIKLQKAYHRRLAILKLLYKEKSIDPMELEKLLTSWPPLTGIQVKDLEGIRPIQLAEIPKDLQVEEEVTMGDMREELGFSRNQLGEYTGGSGDRTATEAMIVRMAHELRIDERRDVLSDLLVDITKGIHEIIFRHWQTEQIIEVAGPLGMPIFVKFTGAMLRGGDYEVKIDPDTGVPETRDIRRQAADKAFTTLNGDPLIDQVQLRQYYLNAMGDPAFDTMLRQLDMQGGGTPAQPFALEDFAKLVGRSQELKPQRQGLTAILGGANKPGQTSAQGVASALT